MVSGIRICEVRIVLLFRRLVKIRKINTNSFELVSRNEKQVQIALSS